jgi:hypothetical protein
MRSGLYIARNLEEALQRDADPGFLHRLLRQEWGAITASGLYGLTLEKTLINTTAINIEAETNKVAMVQDAHTPDFNLHDFYADLTNEVSGTGYTAGGNALTATEVTLAGGVLTYDGADVSWASSTITEAMAGVTYIDAVTDELLCLSDFVTFASTTNGTFTIQWHANGIFTIDYTP